MVLPQLPTYTYGYFKYQQIITKHVHCESLSTKKNEDSKFFVSIFSLGKKT